MPVPSLLDLMNPTLLALRELGGSAAVVELNEKVIQSVSLADDVLTHPRSLRQLHDRMGFARTYLKKQGLITNSERGIWSFTPKGWGIPMVDPKEVRREAHGTARPTPEPQAVLEPEPEIPDEMEQASSESDAAASWRERLLETLLSIAPDAFERLCQRMLRESGFIGVEVTGRTGDQGIDGHGVILMGGLISLPVLFQCKRYRGNVTPEEVRAFRGALARKKVDNGILITTGGFTSKAREEASGGVPRIDLIDGSLLADRLKEMRLGIEVELEEKVTVNADWFKAI